MFCSAWKLRNCWPIFPGVLLKENKLLQFQLFLIVFDFFSAFAQEMTNREHEYLALSRDTTEADLKQRREIRGGTAFYVDQVSYFSPFSSRYSILTFHIDSCSLAGQSFSKLWLWTSSFSGPLHFMCCRPYCMHQRNYCFVYINTR